MKYFPLIWAALWRKPVRTLLTTLALIAAFTLVGLAQGVDEGLKIVRDAQRMDKLYTYSNFGPPMPLAYKQEIAQVPGVKRVIAQIGVGGTVNGDQKKRGFLIASEDGHFEYNTQFNTTPAQIAQLRETRNGIIMSQLMADRLELKVGDHFMLNGMPRKDGTRDWPFEVVAIVDVPEVPRTQELSVGNFDYVNEDVAQGKDMIGRFMVILDRSDTDLATAAARAIDDKFVNSGAGTRTESEGQTGQEQYADNNIPAMVHGIVLAALFALLLLTFNSLMQAFRERIPELGTLKAIGFSDGQVLGLVLAEAVTQCLTGAVIGLAIARTLIPYARKALVSQGAAYMTFDWSVAALGLLAACIVAVLSAAYPAWLAQRMQIVNALAAR